jgi:hypothetical protein
VSRGADIARDAAEQFGHPLSSDLLAMARQNNPGIEISFEWEERLSDGAKRQVLRVQTDRGTVERARDPAGGWLAVFQELGLL